MAPSIVWEKLPFSTPPLKILDPMAGSGTTLSIARSKGHIAYGIDSDPLAVTIAKSWCGDVDKKKLIAKAIDVLKKAKKTAQILTSKTAYPANVDKKTKKFIIYWFDLKNRKQLTALSKHIFLVRDESIRSFLWTAFSRMIITKKVGVSLAMDISHSRPHKVYEKAPVNAFEVFLGAVNKVIKCNPFTDISPPPPKVNIACGDSRCLDYEDNFFDMVITSPPYLNAIDYLRSHKLSLVWMRNNIDRIRELRSTNIGAEVKSNIPDNEHIRIAMGVAGNIHRLTLRQKGFFARYVVDMDLVCSEIARVLKPGGTAILVVGDSTIKGIFISNSKVIESLSLHRGLVLTEIEKRSLPANRRYLPPPSNRDSGKQLQARMRKEIIMTLKKVS
jgi:DNA modification methylase